MHFKEIFSFFIISVLVSCSGPKPGKIYFGGDILTMEGDTPIYVEAIVSEEGKTVFTGTKEEAFKKYQKAQAIDLEGKTIIPGLITFGEKNDLGSFARGYTTILSKSSVEVVNSSEEANENVREIVFGNIVQSPSELTEYINKKVTPNYPIYKIYEYDPKAYTLLGDAQISFLAPIKSVVNMGLHFSIDVGSYSPFFGLWIASMREAKIGRIISPNERVDIFTALKGLTTGPAYQIGEENNKGKIKSGFDADYVILDKNPINEIGESLKSIKVLKTIIKGVTVYPKQ